MATGDVLHVPAGSNLRVTRRALLGATSAAAGLALAASPSYAQEATESFIEDPLFGETFVGVADDGETHIAVVFVEAASGREVRFYACDGATNNLWLTGPAPAAAVSLSGEDTSAQFDLSGFQVTGEVSLPAGAAVTFVAEPASGIAGLYEIGPVSDLLLAGPGTSAQQIQLQVTGSLEDGTQLLAGIIAAEGSAYPVALFASADAAGELRIIVSHEGSAAGGARVVQGAVRGSGFVTTSVQTVSWIDPDPAPWIDPNPEPWTEPDPQP